MNCRSRRARAAALAVAGALVATACSVSGAKPRVLNVYVDDANLDVRALAASCDLGGAKIAVKRLSEDADRARNDLVRRLQADGASVDVLAIDGALIAEFARAGFLRPVPGINRSEFSEDIIPAALEQVTVGEQMFAVPWLFDPQLLWFRPIAAERAGLDMSKPVTWEQLIEAASRVDTSIQIADANGQGLALWLQGLMASAGGTMMEGAGAKKATAKLSTAAGKEAAGVVGSYADSDVGPGPDRQAVDAFAAGDSAFLIGASSTWADPAVAALGDSVDTAAYPALGDKSAAPATGRVLAVSDASEQVAEARTLIDCLTTEAALEQTAARGYAPARSDLLDSEKIETKFDIAADTRRAGETATTVPVSAQWAAVRRAIYSTWLPLSSVSQITPAESQQAAEAALKGELE